MCVEDSLEHTCLVKSGQLDVNVIKGNTVELQKVIQRIDKFC
jgi:hypothetical protein